MHLPQKQAFLDEDPSAYKKGLHQEHKHNGNHLPPEKAFLDEDPSAYKKDLHQEHKHNGNHLPPEKAILDEDMPQKATFNQETYEEEEQHGKQKKKRSYNSPDGKKSDHFFSPTPKERHLFPAVEEEPLKVTSMGYNSPDARKSDNFSPSPKERHLFPAVEKEPLKFTSAGNVASAREDSGAISSPNYTEDYLGSSPAHNSTDFFTAAEKQTKAMQDCKPKQPSQFGAKPRRKSKDKFSNFHGSRPSGSDCQPSPQFQSDLMEDEFFREDVDVLMKGRYGGTNTRKTEENHSTEFLESNFPERCTMYKEGNGLYGEDPSPGKKKKSQKLSVPHLGRKNAKSKSQQCDDPPGATSRDYYVSNAAKVEWRSSQMDMRRTEEYEARELEELPEEDEGDTDSLMEWWNTVEMWDEVPSVEGSTLGEEETMIVTQSADKVHRGLRVFNKVFMEQAEVLYQHVLILHAIANSLSNRRAKVEESKVVGGAVASSAATVGLLLAPLTFGVSLMAVGVAAAIGASAGAVSTAISDANHRKKIELVAGDYLARLDEVARCLAFVREGMRWLSRHPLLRRHDDDYYASSDWAVRRAMLMVSLVREHAEQAATVAERDVAALSGLFKRMDEYYVAIKNGKQKQRKSCKKKATEEVHSVATLLHKDLTELDSIRKKMLDVYGNI
ncbi:hypothetical protein ACEWY4_024911 [Coilia grayii]|uniref:Uncharacterized protein n=1 Tax=Coilia grayii TaxID=363190 RepID=A0ABD1IWG0_9TELE